MPTFFIEDTAQVAFAHTQLSGDDVDIGTQQTADGFDSEAGACLGTVDCGNAVSD